MFYFRTSSISQKRNEIIFDLSLCVGLPIVIMSLCEFRKIRCTNSMLKSEKDFIVQGARFVILEEFGCGSAEVDTGLTILIVSGWRSLLPAISVLFYCRKL